MLDVKADVRIHLIGHKMTTTDIDLIKRLQQMSEAELQHLIIMPLLRELYPTSVIEATHGSHEAGRDIVVLTKHPVLTGDYVVCVKLKNHRLTTGASGPYCLSTLLNQLEPAKHTGVISESGVKLWPNEVWLMTPYAFAEVERRQTRDLLEQIRKLNGRIIAASQLELLIRRHCPHLVEKLFGPKGTVASALIASLLVHAESRAFLLAYDRTVEDFYIQARFHPSGNLVELFRSGSIDVIDPVVTFVLEDRHLKGTNPRSEDFLLLLSAAAYCTMHGQRVSTNSVLPILRDLLSGYEVEVKTGFRKFLATNSRKAGPPQLAQVEVTVTVNLKESANRLKQEIKLSELTLPTILQTTSKEVAKHILLLERAERFLSLTKTLQCVAGRKSPAPADRALIAIGNERLILDIAKVLGIFGGPGSGKTTFLRRLAVALLREGKQVLFLDCSKLRAEHKEYNASRIVKDVVPKSTPGSWKLSDSVVLVDGVDEAPFDMAALIKKLSIQSRHLIFSARTVHQADLSRLAPSLEISRFSTSDRDKFFKTWFATKPEEFETVNNLIERNQDIEEHTRVPLLATLVAALVENG